jgi:hypothetical protein
MGRHKLSWLEYTENDWWELKVKRWWKKANDRDEWASIIKQAKILRRPWRKGIRKYLMMDTNKNCHFVV